jgi:hypothetical protein
MGKTCSKRDRGWNGGRESVREGDRGRDTEGETDEGIGS